MNKEEKELQKKQQNILVNEANDKIGKPYLIYRMFAGIIDFFVMVILSVVLGAILSLVLFKPLGYYDALSNLNNIYKESNLYVENNEGYSLISISEDSSSEEIYNTYESIIINFYNNDSDAIKDNKLAEYRQSQNDSNLFESSYILKEDVLNGDVYNFYTNQYSNAYEYLDNTDKCVIEKDILINAFITTYLIGVFVSLNLTYLLIPLLFKKGSTLGQIIFKMELMDALNKSKVLKKQIIIRSIVHISINYLIPLILLIKFNIGMYAFTPFVCNLFMMCLTKDNNCFNDYISSTTIINKTRTEIK